MFKIHKTANPLKDFAKTLGIRFRDERLLAQALTHPSCRQADPAIEDNQRLEFLGDAVLHLILADALYRSHPRMDEGEMTQARLAIECGASLAAKARAIGLNKLARLGRAEAQKGMAESGKCLEDLFEALIGALWLDRGYKACAALVDALFGEEIALAGEPAAVAESAPRHANPKGALQERAQREYKSHPAYALEREEGEPHAKIFFVSAAIPGCASTGSGAGKSKKDAEIAAAADLLAKLGADAE